MRKYGNFLVKIELKFKTLVYYMHMRHNAIANFSKYCTTPWKTICTVLESIVKIKGVIENSITLTLPDQPKSSPLLFYSV